MKRFFLVFSLFCLFFSFSGHFIIITAQTPTPTSTTTNEPSPIEKAWNDFWNWVSGIFVKTDYEIDTSRTSEEVRSDMNDYGDTNDPNYKNKHSSSGTRLTGSQSQTCLKGNIIKKVTLDTPDYPNTDLSQICLNDSNCFIKNKDATSDELKDLDLTDCQTVSIKDLAHYFVQLQKQFYCSNDQNKLIDTDQNIIDLVEKNYSDSIPENKLNCYQKIYDDFYLVPKDTTDKEEENSKKIIKTPIPNKDQDSNKSSKDLQNQLDQNFSPEGQNGGLNGLRPNSWQ
ncbi:MAG: hypothetical protein PHX34_02760 [Candidatus Shapirobacteria bacterium]|nr:hypothetical protein [Candidatus Shapirobacteria bacterium]